MTDFGSRWPMRLEIVGRTVCQPVVSQEFHLPSHAGVDIMFKTGGTFFCPPTAAIIACADATVWSSALTARGTAVVLDHGAPYATFYQHLSTSFVSKGMKVKAGDIIGVAGADPTDAQRLTHLHFAIWFQGSGDSASVDPAPFLSKWGFR